MRIHFLGATEDVTGSMTLVESHGVRLLVDAGLAQGLRADEINLRELPFDPQKIDLILLTHAHLDHCGYLPRLYKLGLRSPIMCTEETAKLMRVILDDSAQLLAQHENPKLQSFYDTSDVEKVFSHLKICQFHHSYPFKHLQISFHYAGHILGASSIKIQAEKSVLFSGDLGRFDDPLLTPPESAPAACDLVVMEATYGGRIRPMGMEAEINSFLVKVKEENRIGLIASFAVARAQTLLYLIHRFYRHHPEYELPLYIDGPMLMRANDIYKRYAHKTKDPQGLRDALDYFEKVEHFKLREHLKKSDKPKIVISSSGMLSGGPVMNYLESLQHDPLSILFLAGYQAPGTLGRAMGEKQSGLILNHKPFQWQGDIIQAESFSSHADQRELCSWVSSTKSPIVIIHGEEDSKKSLEQQLFPRQVTVAQKGMIYEL
jgi:metallo-beta-lactamase family protein